MIKHKSYLLVTIFLILSCEDTVNYRSDFNEEYVLYCIVDIESNYQQAIVQKTFADNSNPDITDVENVEIYIETRDILYSLSSGKGDGISTPTNYYFTNEYSPSRGAEIRIKAIMPDNSELTSVIQPPKFSLFYIEKDEVSIPLQNENGKNNFRLVWNMTNPSDNLTFIAYLFIDYSKNENGKEVNKRIEVPQKYIIDGDESIPISFSPTKNYYQTFVQESVHSSLLNISDGDTNKSNYKIIGGLLELYVLEENLAEFFTSNETFRNSYSIKVYQKESSNIEGGKGLFGAYIKKSIPVTINNNYIESLGYRKSN